MPLTYRLGLYSYLVSAKKRLCAAPVVGGWVTLNYRSEHLSCSTCSQPNLNPLSQAKRKHRGLSVRAERQCREAAKQKPRVSGEWGSSLSPCHLAGTCGQSPSAILHGVFDRGNQ